MSPQNALANILLEQVRLAPDREYLHTRDGALTRSRVCQIAKTVGAHLRGRPEISAAGGVALAIEDPGHLALALWAGILGDLNVAFLPRVKEPAVMERHLRDAEVPVVLTDEPALVGHPWSLDIASLVKAGGAGAPDQSAGQSHRARAPAFLFQTSGTSGEPKWVVCEFDKCARAVQSMHEAGALEHARDRTVFLTQPLFHSYGLSSLLEYTSAGGTIVFPSNTSPFGPAGDLQRCMLREQISAIEGVPYLYFQLSRLASRIRLPALRHIGLGGGPLDPRVIEQLIASYPGVTISVRYGLTETPSVVTHKVFRPPYDEDWRSSGRLMPAYTLRIIDAAGNDVPPGQEGEILVGGECVAAYRGQPPGPLKTGDLGLLSASGELIVVGRSSAYLKHRGFRLSPESVESAIGQFPAVRDCRVLVRDSKLVAEVVCDEDVTCRELPAFLARQLPAYAVPDEVVRVAEIPRTASGKIRRH